MAWPEGGEGVAVSVTFGLLGPREAFVPSFGSERQGSVFPLHWLERDCIMMSANTFAGFLIWLQGHTLMKAGKKNDSPVGHICHWPQLHLLELCPGQMSSGCCLQSNCSHSPLPPRQVIGLPQSLAKAQYQRASDSCLFPRLTWKSNFLDMDYKTGRAPKDISPILSDYVFTGKLSTF